MSDNDREDELVEELDKIIFDFYPNPKDLGAWWREYYAIEDQQERIKYAERFISMADGSYG